MSNSPLLTPDQSVQEGPRRFFDAEALGSSFQQLAIDVVKGETTDFMSRWFRAKANDADLVIWTDGEKRIIKHQLCFYGQVVEWNPINGTRTGLVIEEEVGDGVKSDVNAAGSGDVTSNTGSNSADDRDNAQIAETIRFDASIEKYVVGQAIQVLARVPDLSEADRSALIYNFRESPRLHKKAAERALKAWAPKIDEINSTIRPKFWKRLRDWVLGT